VVGARWVRLGYFSGGLCRLPAAPVFASYFLGWLKDSLSLDGLTRNQMPGKQIDKYVN